MEVADAVKAAESDPAVREHMGDGFYLSSLLTIPENLNEITQWSLVYFNPANQKVFSVDVTPGSVKKTPESSPLVEGNYSKLECRDALETRFLLAKLTEILVKEREFPMRVIITLRDCLWKVALVTQSVKMIRVDLDMKTGELKSIDKSSLIKTA